MEELERRVKEKEKEGPKKGHPGKCASGATGLLICNWVRTYVDGRMTGAGGKLGGQSGALQHYYSYVRMCL